MLGRLREQVCELNMELPKQGLVSWTSGNVSGRDPKTNLMVIKPSGVRFEALRPDDMVVMDMEGKVVEGGLKPSSDAYTHIYIYRARPDVGGVVHTHSNYATAFAAVGKPIPAVLTSMGDEIGGPIPLGGFAFIGDEEIGREVVERIGKAPAIIMQNHGVFAIGPSAEEALKAAIRTEEYAKTVWLALQIGTPIPIPEEALARLYERYHKHYGQGDT